MFFSYLTTYPNVHQMSKHITFNQKKLAKNEKWMTKAETKNKQNVLTIKYYRV